MLNSFDLHKRQKILIASAMLSLAPLATPTAQAQQTSDLRQLNCFTGPVTRTFGAGQWLVYSCDDNSSLVAASVNGNPAFPFIFFIQKDRDGRYKVRGEGTGDKKASDAAGDEISGLSPTDFAALLQSTLAKRTTR